jgi:aromatic ring hydroxylase
MESTTKIRPPVVNDALKSTLNGTGKGARNGSDYIASLQDGRSVWIDGERIKDVTVDRRFRGAVQSIADLYDLQSDPALQGKMTFSSPTSGLPVGLSFMLPRSADDLLRRRVMMKTWMDAVGGMMGRTPDFLNVMVSAHASAHQLFAVGGDHFGQNIVKYHEHIRENDLALTHSLVSPDIDKRKQMFEQPGDMVMRVVRESDAGIYVSGARSVAKMEFLLGIAYNLVETNHSQFPNVMGMLSELVAFVEILRGMVRVSEIDCIAGPNGTVVPYEQPLNVVRAQYPAMHARALEILQFLGAGNLMVAPTVEDLNSEPGPAIQRYCAGAEIPAERKMQLMRLAWDASCSSFAGRQNLYEKFFSGDPFRNAAMRAERYPSAREAQDRVWAFLDRNDEWERRINGTNAPAAAAN